MKVIFHILTALIVLTYSPGNLSFPMWCIIFLGWENEEIETLTITQFYRIKGGLWLGAPPPPTDNFLNGKSYPNKLYIVGKGINSEKDSL